MPIDKLQRLIILDGIHVQLNFYANSITRKVIEQ